MIELEQARDLLRRAVETQGRDFVYNPGAAYACQYKPSSIIHYRGLPMSKTGCLIGVALDLAGETRHHNCHGVNVTGIYERYPIMMSQATAKYFLAAQIKQDGGSTWGEAFDYAEASIGSTT